MKSFCKSRKSRVELSANTRYRVDNCIKRLQNREAPLHDPRKEGKNPALTTPHVVHSDLGVQALFWDRVIGTQCDCRWYVHCAFIDWVSKWVSERGQEIRLCIHFGKTGVKGEIQPAGMNIANSFLRRYRTTVVLLSSKRGYNS